MQNQIKSEKQISKPTQLTPTSSHSIKLSPSHPKASTLGSSSTLDNIKNQNRESDWWKHSSPSKEEVKKVSSSSFSSGLGGITRKKRSVDEFKMCGEWRVGEGIGRGVSGKVRLARHTVTNEFAAIKMIKKPIGFDSHTDSNALQREITLMKLVESPHIVRLLDVFQTKSHIYLITEYCENGDLFHFVNDKKRLNDYQIHKIFSQIVTALSHLRTHTVAHRDIKFENLLLDSDFNLKLADFGMAIFCRSDSLLETSCGSPHYAAPEVIVKEGYNGMIADIWSCGVVLYALLSRQLPFDDDNIPNLLCQIKVGHYYMHPEIEGNARDLIRKILVVDPAKRITLDRIISHPYLQQYGEYIPPSCDLPFPLSEGIGQEIPTSKNELDDDLIKQLQLCIRATSTEEVINSILQQEGASQAKTFYAILKNFRARAGTDEDVKDAVIATANRLIIHNIPRRVKSANPILSHQSTTIESSKVSSSTSIPDIRSLTPVETVTFPTFELSQFTPSKSSSSKTIEIEQDTITFPYFSSTSPPHGSPEAIRSLPGSPTLKDLVPGFRPMTIQGSSQSVPTSPEQRVLATDLQLEHKLLSPRSKKFSMQRLKHFFSSSKLPLKEKEEERFSEIEVVVNSDEGISKVKRSPRISSFGKLMKRLSTSPLSESSTATGDFQTSPQESPSSSKLLKQKKSWARMESFATSPGSPKSPKSPGSPATSPTRSIGINRKKSWAWGTNRPESLISNDENLPPSTPTRRVSIQISNWLSNNPPPSPAPSIPLPSPFLTPTSTPISTTPTSTFITTKPESKSTTKRRPSPLQLPSSNNSQRTSSSNSIMKRIPTPTTFTTAIAPLTPEKTPVTDSNKVRPELYTNISVSIYSESGETVEEEPDVSGSTTENKNGLLSPPLTSGSGALNFLGPSIQRHRKSSLISNYSERQEGVEEEMKEKILRLEKENQDLRIALEVREKAIQKSKSSIKKILENKENSFPITNTSTSTSSSGNNHGRVSISNSSTIRPLVNRNRTQSSTLIEKDELIEMVDKLSFESDGVVERRWLQMVEDQEFNELKVKEENFLLRY